MYRTILILLCYWSSFVIQSKGICRTTCQLSSYKISEYPEDRITKTSASNFVKKLTATVSNATLLSYITNNIQNTGDFQFSRVDIENLTVTLIRIDTSCQLRDIRMERNPGVKTGSSSLKSNLPVIRLYATLKRTTSALHTQEFEKYTIGYITGGIGHVVDQLQFHWYKC
ncbi:hypothetical protein I4U23_019966 [Adineta vaga]|nr:hypothetical protein I4U23_019966 [Adineta vaga]